MPDRPFGFGPPGGGRPGSGSSGSGSSGSGSGSSGGPPDETGGGSPFGPLGDPQQFADALRQFADLMSWQGGPVNWDLAKNVARHTVAAEGDPSVLDVDRHKIVDALRLADLWLDEATSFSTGVRIAEAWSRSEWVEATLPVWSKLCDPIADRAVDAMGGMLAEDPSELGAGLPAELTEAFNALGGGLAGLGGMMRRIGGMMVGSQTGAEFAGIFGEDAAHRVHCLVGDRVTQRRPDGQGGLHPFRPAPGLRLPYAGGEAGDLVQPQVSEPERVHDLVPVHLKNAGIAFGRHGVPRHVFGEVPVHRAALPGHQVRELPQGVSELLRVTERPERARVAALATRAAGGS